MILIDLILFLLIYLLPAYKLFDTFIVIRITL